MRCAFFHGVDWEAVLRREGPGPWVPPEDPVITRRKKLVAEKEAEAKRIAEGVFITQDAEGTVDNDGNVPVSDTNTGDAVESKLAAQRKGEGTRAEDEEEEDELHLPGWEMSTEAAKPSAGISKRSAVPHPSYQVRGDSTPTSSSQGGQVGSQDGTAAPSSQSSSELMNVDDSVLAPSRLPPNALRVADWSYMDANVIQKAAEKKH